MTTIRADVEAAANVIFALAGNIGKNVCIDIATIALTASDHARLSQMPEVAEIAQRLRVNAEDWARNYPDSFKQLMNDAAALLSTLQSALERKDGALAHMKPVYDAALAWGGNEMFADDDELEIALALATRTARAALATQPKEKA